MKKYSFLRLMVCLLFLCISANSSSFGRPHFDSLKWKLCKEIIELSGTDETDRELLIDNPDYPAFEKTKLEFLNKTQLNVYDSSSALTGECYKYYFSLLNEKSTFVDKTTKEIIITSAFEVPYSLFHDCFLKDEIRQLAQQSQLFYHSYYKPIYMTCIEHATNSITINNWKKCFNDSYGQFDPCPEMRRFEMIDQINEEINNKRIPICSKFYDDYWKVDTEDQLLNYEGYFEECMKALQRLEFIKTNECVRDQLFTPMFIGCSEKKNSI